MLETYIRNAESIITTAQDAVRDLELALEQHKIATQRKTEAIRQYEDAEAEFAYVVMCSDGYIAGKNADIRKAFLDVCLVRARNGGELQTLWANRLMAEGDFHDAALALEQATARFGAVKCVTELQGAILRALSN